MVRVERQRHTGKVIAFVPIAGSHGYPFALGVAVLGEPGYSRPNVPQSFNTYDSASDMADRMNSLLGLHPNTVAAIFAETLHRQTFRQDEERGLTAVKLTQVEITTLMSAVDQSDILDPWRDEITYKLESALI